MFIFSSLFYSAGHIADVLFRKDIRNRLIHPNSKWKKLSVSEKEKYLKEGERIWNLVGDEKEIVCAELRNYL